MCPNHYSTSFKNVDFVQLVDRPTSIFDYEIGGYNIGVVRKYKVKEMK